jgi:hypothetical protein
MPRFTAIWAPAVSHTFPDGTAELVTDPSLIPSGVWSITLISKTGQTWVLPNATGALDSTDPAFDPLTQLGYLEVR